MSLRVGQQQRQGPERGPRTPVPKLGRGLKLGPVSLSALSDCLLATQAAKAELKEAPGGQEELQASFIPPAGSLQPFQQTQPEPRGSSRRSSTCAPGTVHRRRARPHARTRGAVSPPGLALGYRRWRGPRSQNSGSLADAICCFPHTTARSPPQI